MNVQDIITEHLDIWTTAQQQQKSGGRGRGRKKNDKSLYGIKKLRELILDLAVRGKLVEQNSEDEPASVLLEKIAEEKERLIKEGKIKNQKILPEITEKEKPFALPDGWEWARLGIITSKITDGDHKTPPRTTEGYRLLSAKNVRNGFLDFETCDFISEQHYLKSRERCLPEEGDLLIVSVGGTIGRTSLVPDDSCFSLVRSVALIKPLLFDSSYLKYAMDSELLQSSIHSRKRGGAQPCLYLSEMAQFLFSLPPLLEQHRIVSKVDELMAFCDQLEQQQTTSNATHQTLLETLLATLIKSADHQTFTAAWERIATHFDVLFTTEQSIDQLQQTILQLAVMGKLVPQNPEDEPASRLLEKIAKEKARLFKEGKIKKQKKLPEIREEEKPFALPDGWEWVRLGGLCPSFQNGVSSRGDKIGKEIVVLRLADIKNWRISLKDTRCLIIGEKSIEKYCLEENDVLIIRVNGSAEIVGRFILSDSKISAIYCDHFIRMRFPVKSLAPAYIKLLGSSELIRKSISELFVSTAGQKTVNQKHINSLLVTLPPLVEQHRIVAKVDELIALCDQLKTCLHENQSTKIQLADTIVSLNGDHS